jgi:hypothetical protein
MIQSDKDLEKQYSAFDRDLSTLEDVGTSNEDMDFSHTKMDYNLPENHEEEQVEQQKLPKPSIELPEEQGKNSPVVEELPTINEEPPRPVHPPLTGDDMKKLADQLEKAINGAIPLLNQTQRMIADHDDIRLPKGLRTTSTLLSDLADVFIATKALIDLYLELGVEPLYQTVDDTHLKTVTTNATRTFLAHVPTMQEGLDDVEKAMKEGYDRPSANLRIRIVKGQAKICQTLVIHQAQALAQTIEAFPLENGALRVLCLLQEKDDIVMMNSMDKTMEIAEHIQVPVVDAPAMLEAVRNNDQKAVDAIIHKKLQTSNS